MLVSPPAKLKSRSHNGAGYMPKFIMRLVYTPNDLNFGIRVLADPGYEYIVLSETKPATSILSVGRGLAKRYLP